MADTALSWEQIVERVTISSNYLAVRFAEAKWREAFRQSRQVAELIRNDLSRRNAASWKGPGAEAFRAHLGELAKVVDLNVEKHEKIADERAAGLKRCADALEHAVKNIPVPSWLYDEVKQRQLDFALNGVPANIQPHWFWQQLVGPNPQGWTGDALKQAEQICRQAEATARQIYARLCEVYREEAAKMPEGTPVPVPGVNQPVGAGRAGTRGSTSTNPANTTSQQPLASPVSTTTPAPTTPGGLTETPPIDTPPIDTSPPTLPDLDDLDTSPSDFTPGTFSTGDFGGTGLAGIGGIGGARGLGDPAGISTAGFGSPGMGPAVPLPPGVLAARAAAGAGVGAGVGMMPFAPMMGGGHGAGDSGQQTHCVKLQEDDEDIFRPRQASSCVIDV